MQKYAELRVVVAAYGIPGIFGIEALFAMGVQPRNIMVLTHATDDRNRPLYDYALAQQIPVVQDAAKSDACLIAIRNHMPDALFSLHYRCRIPPRILDVPRYGCVNLHPSLLPNYRGCFSAPWAIINGEARTGFSYHRMVENFDEGHLIVQREVAIGAQETGFSLFHKLIVEGLRVFPEVVELVIDRAFVGTPQSPGGSYYSREVPFGGKIDCSWDESRIERYIRAMIFPPLKGAILVLNETQYEVKSLEQYRALMNTGRP